MSFKVLHRGYQHIRLSSSFSLTLDIQDYLRSLARDEKGIESIQFYMDQQHFTLRIKEGFSEYQKAEPFVLLSLTAQKPSALLKKNTKPKPAQL